MRSRLLLLCLAAATCCLAWGALAFAQTGEPSEGDGGGGGVYASSVDAQPVLSNSFPLAYVIRKGLPLSCGQAADTKHGDPDVSCHIDATVTVKSAVAKFLGLGSDVIAKGVAGNPVDHLTDDNDEDMGRVYYLALPASVKSKLRAKHAKALGVHVTGTVTAHTAAGPNNPASDKVYCPHSQDPADSCAIKAGKRSIIPAGDGELVCWRYMPWYLATPAKWGKMCPRPKQI